MARIEICGGIASGKTTLAEALAPTPIYERFADNPFWRAFYTDPARWAEEKNFSLLLQHTAAIKEAPVTPLAVCDYAVLQDLAYATLTGSNEHLRIMRALFSHLYGQLPPPALIVHLKCDPTIQLQRIAQRARSEEAGISATYLEALNRATDVILDEVPKHIPVRTIASTEVNLVSNPHAIAELRRELLGAIRLSE